MTLPAVETLKHRFPNCHITYACDRHSTGSDIYYQLVKNVPFINDIIDARYIDRSKYDGLVDLTSVCIRHENGSGPKINRIDIFAKACGLQRPHNPVPYYRVEPQEANFATTIVGPLKAKGKRVVFLHTASNDPKRCWPVRRYRELVLLCQEKRPDVHFLLSDFNNVFPDKDQYSNVTIVTNGDIRKLAAVINASDLFIGPDSGPMHIAGALGKRSLCLFGSIPSKVRVNYYSNSIGIESMPKLSCQYCWYGNCNVGIKCMSNITAEQVYSRMASLL
jgi:ADP-heptose:LPS heptosyltransferase